MKRVRCPKCKARIPFDDSRYVEGQTLVFECPECHKQFGLRIKASESDSPTESSENYGHIIVVENVFHFRQEFPLLLGDNTIGRYVHGTNVTIPIETVDPSVDTTHCVINVSRNRAGTLIYILRDASTDGTGTFVGLRLLSPADRLHIENGTIITIGATTLILQAADCEDEETTAESR